MLLGRVDNLTFYDINPNESDEDRLRRALTAHFNEQGPPEEAEATADLHLARAREDDVYLSLMIRLVEQQEVHANHGNEGTQ